MWNWFIAGKAYTADCQKVIVDPPSGWQHGFPAHLEEDYPAQLLKAGYKDSEIDMCLKHSRYWAA